MIPDRWRELAAAHPSILGWARQRQWARMARRLGVDRAEAKAFGLWLAGEGGAIDGAPRLPTAGADKVETARDGDGKIVTSHGSISTLAELLEAAGIDRGAWAVTRWVANKWDAMGKDGPVPMWQVKAWLSRVPEFVQTPIRAVRHVVRKQSRGRDVARALIVPDSQNGYRVDRRSNTWAPLHDRRAWDLAVQVAQRMQPDEIVMLGDMLDLAPFGKYTTTPDLHWTTQPTLAELHWWIGQLRLAAPAARITWIEGNHEYRLRRALADQVSEASDLRPVDDPGGPEALSVERLMALGDLDVDYVGPYPAGEYWLWDSVRVIHGDIARKGSGASASAIIRDASTSTVFGHVHRLEFCARTMTDADGQSTIYAMSPGTIARLDGVVPGSTRRANWQQGLGYGYRIPGGVSLGVLPIQSGRLVYRGQLLEGEERIEEIREATGFKWF